MVNRNLAYPPAMRCFHAFARGGGGGGAIDDEATEEDGALIV